MVWVPAKMTVDPDARTVPAVQVQLWVVRKMPVIVRLPPGLLTFTIGRSAVAANASVQAWSRPPLMSSVPDPPRKVDATAMAPWAAIVPVFTAPPVRVNVPSTVTVPALMVLVPDRNWTLLKVAPPVKATFTLLVEKTTLPPLWVKTPAARVTAPVTVSVAVVLVKATPALTVNAPLMVIAEFPPRKAAADWTYPEAPTVSALPAAWVTIAVIPVYAALMVMPVTVTSTSIVAAFVLVALKTTVSAASGTASPDQLRAVDHRLSAPPPSQVRTAARAGGAATSMPASTATTTPRGMTPRTDRGSPLRRHTPRWRRREEWSFVGRVPALQPPLTDLADASAVPAAETFA